MGTKIEDTVLLGITEKKIIRQEIPVERSDGTIPCLAYLKTLFAHYSKGKDLNNTQQMALRIQKRLQTYGRMGASTSGISSIGCLCSEMKRRFNEQKHVDTSLPPTNEIQLKQALQLEDRCWHVEPKLQNHKSEKLNISNLTEEKEH